MWLTRCWTAHPKDDQMKSRAFCPGHVTGFFEVFKMEDPLSTGSRGAGVCISLGATSEVRVERSDTTTVEIAINGVEADAPVTRRSVERLLEGEPFAVDVDISLDLPERQGFGMSAAGSLSTSVALCDIFECDRQKAFEAAHVAEVECGGGLGDVSALHRAGVTVREKAGLPPIGHVMRIEERPDVVLVVVGPPMRTEDVLADEDTLSAINKRGGKMVEQLLARPSVDMLMRLSRKFATDTGLATDEVLSTIEAVGPKGTASMSMLGNSVFAIGVNERSLDMLTALGDVFACSTDVDGPRLV